MEDAPTGSSPGLCASISRLTRQVSMFIPTMYVCRGGRGGAHRQSVLARTHASISGPRAAHGASQRPLAMRLQRRRLADASRRRDPWQPAIPVLDSSGLCRAARRLVVRSNIPPRIGSLGVSPTIPAHAGLTELCCLEGLVSQHAQPHHVQWDSLLGSANVKVKTCCCTKVIIAASTDPTSRMID